MYLTNAVKLGLEKKAKNNLRQRLQRQRLQQLRQIFQKQLKNIKNNLKKKKNLVQSRLNIKLKSRRELLNSSIFVPATLMPNSIPNWMSRQTPRKKSPFKPEPLHKPKTPSPKKNVLPRNKLPPLRFTPAIPLKSPTRTRLPSPLLHTRLKPLI